MAVPPYREKLIQFLESVGTLEARRLKLQNHFHSEDWQALDRWLSIKEAEGKARSDDRAEESLSIARNAFSISCEALRFSRIATIIAVIAIAFNARDHISAFVMWVLESGKP